MNKDTLRQKAKLWVNDLTPRDKLRRDEKIASALDSLLKKLITDEDFILGAYWPLKDEVVWDWKLTLPKSVKVAYPVMTEDKNLEYWIFDGQKEKKKQVSPHILLVPGLMFSLKGERLGRGGGYFDRFLPSFKGKTVGVCYEENIGHFPVEKHDCYVQGILTEKGYRASL